jgi:hypothetical protein
MYSLSTACIELWFRLNIVACIYSIIHIINTIKRHRIFLHGSVHSLQSIVRLHMALVKDFSKLHDNSAGLPIPFQITYHTVYYSYWAFYQVTNLPTGSPKSWAGAYSNTPPPSPLHATSLSIPQITCRMSRKTVDLCSFFQRKQAE